MNEALGIMASRQVVDTLCLKQDAWNKYFQEGICRGGFWWYCCSGSVQWYDDGWLAIDFLQRCWLPDSGTGVCWTATGFQKCRRRSFTTTVIAFYCNITLQAAPYQARRTHRTLLLGARPLNPTLLLLSTHQVGGLWWWWWWWWWWFWWWWSQG